MHFQLTTGLQTTMTLQDFFFMMLWIALIILIVVIIGIFVRLFQTMGDIRAIVKDNKNNIDGILNEVPDITKNVGGISGEAHHLLSALRPTVDNVAETAENVTKTLKDNNPVNEAITGAYKTVSNLNKLVESTSRSKKNSVTIDFDKNKNVTVKTPSSTE